MLSKWVRFYIHKEGDNVSFCISHFNQSPLFYSTAFITSSKGPAHSISNLYFSSWIGFIVSVGLFMSILDDFKRKSANPVSEASGSTNGHTEQVEEGRKNDDPATEDVDL
jgi:hypothetical protein